MGAEIQVKMNKQCVIKLSLAGKCDTESSAERLNDHAKKDAGFSKACEHAWWEEAMIGVVIAEQHFKKVYETNLTTFVIDRSEVFIAS